MFMKTLVIAEKPDMGRHIAAAIDHKAKHEKTYLEGDRYIFTWAIGHLIELAEPDAYDPRYKKWNIEDLPILPDAFKLVPIRKTRSQLKVIQELARRCDLIVNACDAGREGQLIFAFIQRYLNLRQPVKRLWISDLTPETIRKGFAKLQDGAKFDNLTRAARARSEADWLVGINGTRAFTTKHGVLLSVGRVQTPVLALIYDRQKEIETFQPTRYYVVEAHFRQEGTRYRGIWQGETLKEAARSEAIAAKVRGRSGTVSQYDRKQTREYPFKLYDLTLLQREANARFGFSAKKTLDLAQSLYEKHKAISYPRTTSNYVTEANIPDMHRMLDQFRQTEYRPFVEGADKRLVHKGNKSVCNPAKVEDHHAILPTMKLPSRLQPDEQKLYDLIVRRFLAQFYPPAEYLVHTILTDVEGERFKTTIKQLVSEGWKVLYPGAAGDKPSAKSRTGKGSTGTARNAKEEDEEQDSAEEIRLGIGSAFQLDPSRPVACTDSLAVEKETRPPKPYTEGTLLKAMESAGKQLEDEELREAMKDSGLGTPATRAATIERLKEVGYISMQGKQIAITNKGRAAIEVIRAAGIHLLTSPEMTGRWEQRLNEIAKGLAEAGPFMEQIRKFARHMTEKVKLQQPMDPRAFADDASARPAYRKAKRSSRSAAGKKKTAPVQPGTAEANGGRIQAKAGSARRSRR